MNQTNTMSTETLITENATLLSKEGYITHRGVSVAYHTDEDGDQYIRVGSALMWRADVLEESDRLTCLASGATILL